MSERPAPDVNDPYFKALIEEHEPREVETPTPPEPTPGKESQATKLVHLAETSGAEFFHTPGDKDPYARISVAGHWEVWPQRRKGFKNWLQGLYYEEHGGAPNSTAMQDALGVLGSKALFAGEQHPVFTRVGEAGGALYHDLGNEEWEAVEVTAEGWQVVPEPPVRFRRTRGMQSLPHPESGGSLEELRRWANAGSDDDFRLYVGWLVQALRPQGPFIGYSAHGEQGSAKSTRGKIARALLDPNSAPLRTRPRDERDLLIAATNSWVVTIDNLSSLPDWFSDALCRLATGGGLATRQLYTDGDEIIFDAQRSIFLNGIEEVAHRGDLLDRLILAHLPRISEEERKPENELWASFEEARPRLFGALLDAASCALRNLDSVQLDRHPRMADAARWVTAAEPALGWEPGTFLAAYERNRAVRDELALEASPLGQLLVEAAVGGFTGTMTELLARLALLAGEEATKAKTWPKNANALSGLLRRLAPNLRAAGVDVDFEREPGGQRRRLVLLRAVAHEPVPSVPSVPEPASRAEEDGTEGGTHGTQGGRTPVPAPSPLPTRPLAPSGDARDARDAAVHPRSDGAVAPLRAVASGQATPRARSGDEGEATVAPLHDRREVRMQFSDEAIEAITPAVVARHPGIFPPGTPEEQIREQIPAVVEAELVAEGERLLELRRPGLIHRPDLITPGERRRLALVEVAHERARQRAAA